MVETAGKSVTIRFELAPLVLGAAPSVTVRVEALVASRYALFCPRTRPAIWLHARARAKKEDYDAPVRRIDYVLCNRDSGLRCVACQVIEEPVASDHRPVLAVFQLDGG